MGFLKKIKRITVGAGLLKFFKTPVTIKRSRYMFSVNQNVCYDSHFPLVWITFVIFLVFSPQIPLISRRTCFAEPLAPTNKNADLMRSRIRLIAVAVEYTYQIARFDTCVPDPFIQRVKWMNGQLKFVTWLTNNVSD